MPIDITDQPRRVQYAISGTGPYDFDFEVLAQTDIAVYRDATLLALTTNYTVALNSDGTGAVTLLSATGTTLTILGARPYERTTDYAVGGDFGAETLNNEFDSFQIQILQLREEVDRSIKVAPYDESEVSAELPTSRAGQFLVFDALGNAATSAGTGADAGLRTDLTAVGGSAFVSYTNTSTGAVARTVRARLGDFVDGADFGIAVGGTDQTTKLISALASGENILLQRGVIGYDGDSALAWAVAGQMLHGRGTTDVATLASRGTVLKKLAADGADSIGFSVPTFLEGIEIANLCFDENNLEGPALKFKGHKGRLHNLVFHNQGGAEFALVVSHVNFLQADNIIGSGDNYGLMHIETESYGAYYSTFKGVRSLNPTTSNAIKINGSSALTFLDTFLESEAYITAGNIDIRFFGLRGELGARSLLKVDGLGGGSSDVLVKGGKANVFVDGTASVFFFDFANTSGITIEDFSFTDERSVAGRAYINLNAVDGFAARNITARNTTDPAVAHWLFTGTAAGARSERVSLENIHVLSGDVRTDLEMSGRIVNSNSPVTFIAGSQLVACHNVQANVNTANCSSGISLHDCNDVTDVGGFASRFGFGGAVSTIFSTPAAAELALQNDGGNVYSVTGNTNITSIRDSDSTPGRVIHLLFTGTPTLTDGNNLKLGANFVATADDGITLVCNAARNWIAVGPGSAN